MEWWSDGDRRVGTRGWITYSHFIRETVRTLEKQGFFSNLSVNLTVRKRELEREGRLFSIMERAVDRWRLPGVGGRCEGAGVSWGCTAVPPSQAR